MIGWRLIFTTNSSIKGVFSKIILSRKNCHCETKSCKVPI